MATTQTVINQGQADEMVSVKKGEISNFRTQIEIETQTIFPEQISGFHAWWDFTLALTYCFLFYQATGQG